MKPAAPTAAQLRRQWADDAPALGVDPDRRVTAFYGDARTWWASERLGAPFAELFAAATGADVERVFAAVAVPAEAPSLWLADGRRIQLCAARVAEGWLVGARDVTTDWVLAQARAHQLGMAALGGLAGAVARELNDPMSIVQGRLELLLALGDVDAEGCRRHLSIALEHARRISATLQNLRVVGQPRDQDLGAVELRAAVDEALGLLGSRRDRVKTEIDPPDLSVGGDAAMYVRVLANALRQVMEGVARGTVSLRAERDGGRVRVCVDIGRRGRAEPLEGADVTIDETLLRAVGGTIEALRVAGAPAFVIGLPLPPAVRSRARPVEEEMLVVGSEGFAEAVRRLLDKDGYRFVNRSDADSALAWLEAATERGPVVSELLLAGPVSGLGLGWTAVQRWPELAERVVVVTDAPIVPLPDSIVPLSKPLSRASLLDALGRRVRRVG